jgi:hypothetical protein
LVSCVLNSIYFKIVENEDTPLSKADLRMNSIRSLSDQINPMNSFLQNEPSTSLLVNI